MGEKNVYHLQNDDSYEGNTITTMHEDAEY